MTWQANLEMHWQFSQDARKHARNVFLQTQWNEILVDARLGLSFKIKWFGAPAKLKIASLNAMSLTTDVCMIRAIVLSF